MENPPSSPSTPSVSGVVAQTLSALTSTASPLHDPLAALVAPLPHAQPPPGLSLTVTVVDGGGDGESSRGGDLRPGMLGARVRYACGIATCVQRATTAGLLAPSPPTAHVASARSPTGTVNESGGSGEGCAVDGLRDRLSLGGLSGMRGGVIAPGSVTARGACVFTTGVSSLLSTRGGVDAPSDVRTDSASCVDMIVD